MTEQALTIDRIRELESSMLALPAEYQVDASRFTFHHFCDGLYARELFVPQGTTIVGKQHAQQNFFLLIAGEMAMTLADGTVARVVAPYMAVVLPGSKRIGHALTDCVCMNIHPNPDNAQAPEVLEARYTLPEALPAPDSKELLS